MRPVEWCGPTTGPESRCATAYLWASPISSVVGMGENTTSGKRRGRDSNRPQNCRKDNTLRTTWRRIRRTYHAIKSHRSGLGFAHRRLAHAAGSDPSRYPGDNPGDEVRTGRTVSRCPAVGWQTVRRLRGKNLQRWGRGSAPVIPKRYSQAGFAWRVPGERSQHEPHFLSRIMQRGVEPCEPWQPTARPTNYLTTWPATGPAAVTRVSDMSTLSTSTESQIAPKKSGFRRHRPPSGSHAPGPPVRTISKNHSALRVQPWWVASSTGGPG